jgi:hypothetical protein
MEALEMWIYRRLGKIVWSEKKTNNEVLKQLKLKRYIFNITRKGQMNFVWSHKKAEQHFKRHIRRKDSR